MVHPETSPVFPPPGRRRAEVRFDPGLVRGLLRDQAPAYADLPFGAVVEGWDNTIVRLGERHAVRLPRRAAAAPLIRHEQRWLPVLAPRLPLRVPVPVVAGAPACGFPWHWSVVEWVDGQSAASRPLSDPDALAGALADFLTALHTIAPADAPPNPPISAAHSWPWHPSSHSPSSSLPFRPSLNPLTSLPAPSPKPPITPPITPWMTSPMS